MAGRRWADLVLHAGDWVDVWLLDALESRAKRLVGVAGADYGLLRERLPQFADVEVEGSPVRRCPRDWPGVGT